MTTLFTFLAIAAAACLAAAIIEAVLETATDAHEMRIYRVLSTIDMYRRTRRCAE